MLMINDWLLLLMHFNGVTPLILYDCIYKYCNLFEIETFTGVPLSVLFVGTTQILVNKGKVYLEFMVI